MARPRLIYQTCSPSSGLESVFGIRTVFCRAVTKVCPGGLGERKAQALHLYESPQTVLEVEAMVDLNRLLEETVAEPTQESACEDDLVS
jgi:hypothetical protein